MNQLIKVAADIGSKCLAGNNSGFDTHSQSAVALCQHTSVLSGGEEKSPLIKRVPHLALREEAVL